MRGEIKILDEFAYFTYNRKTKKATRYYQKIKYLEDEYGHTEIISCSMYSKPETLISSKCFEDMLGIGDD